MSGTRIISFFVVILFLNFFVAEVQCVNAPQKPQPSLNFYANVTIIDANNKTLETGEVYIDQHLNKLAYYSTETVIFDCSNPNKSNIVLLSPTTSSCTAVCVQGVSCFGTNCSCISINPWAALAAAQYVGGCPYGFEGNFWAAPKGSVPPNFPFAFCFSENMPIFVLTVTTQGVVVLGLFNNFTPGIPNESFFNIPSTCKCTNIYDDN